MDYGTAFSPPAIDVLTGLDNELSVTSKYPLLKGSLPGSGTITIPSGTAQTVTIPHGLGYVPIVQAFGFDDSTFLNPFYFQLPVYYFDGDIEVAWTVEADATNVYLTFGWADFLGGLSMTVLYKFFIFLDKGDL